MKPLLILALGFAALFLAPVAASAATAGAAAPANEVATVARDWSANSTPVQTVSKQLKNGDASINAVFDCRYFSRVPFTVVTFTCQVTSGAIQVFVNCADGRQVSSAILPAVGTYNFNLSCGTARISTFRVQTIA
ncbi:hypothetical protein [Amycolatopsis anabasis]|uniref:hypothetical protein n=1 Tax=Amycolatopsis anabasis TaxID=1840409 RepID=UPI00131EBB0F|nr:hypothetical protein [Amycolatopsis anabasis]